VERNSEEKRKGGEQPSSFVLRERSIFLRRKEGGEAMSNGEEKEGGKRVLPRGGEKGDLLLTAPEKR